MFTFSVDGKVSFMAKGKQGQTVLKIKPDGSFPFKRQGERPTNLTVEVPVEVPLPSLSLDSEVHIEGIVGVGEHTHTKKEYGVEKSQNFDNHYFMASKVTAAKSQKVA